MSKKRPQITQHFVERYRERVDPDATVTTIIRDIITDRLMNAINTLSNGTFPVYDKDFSIVVEDGKFVTVLTPEKKVNKKKRKLRYTGDE